MNTIVIVGLVVIAAVTVGVLVAVLRRPNSSGQLTVAAIQARLADEKGGNCVETADSRTEEDLAAAEATSGQPRSEPTQP
ncbi:hypothetical protein ACFYT3_11255 [Nocardia amikacinitolerans]|uniref:hypothetical protein n=1 Tax=Nocardia amikacinitolerans TaxID=756689 RepID=UPI0020A3ABB7|nr:hypothetical protein [Nocardia amikacinitolerans]MCP2290195.1 hypothetical protein [Nocardia amikacinitolerans]